MERYFYHGVSDYMDVGSLDMMLEIIKSGGLKTRSSVRNFGNCYDHVCLFRKNDQYDYNDRTNILNSAYSGWVGSCFGFVISPDIAAEKVEVGSTTGFLEDGRAITDLIDEWRSVGDIPLDKIVGIYLPFDSIEACKNDSSSLFDEDFDERKAELLDTATRLGLFIVNSDEANFTDKLDSQLESNKGEAKKQ